MDEHLIPFLKLPTEVSRLSNEIALLRDLVVEQRNDISSRKPTDRLLTIQEAAKFLHLSVSTIYGKVSRSEIPYLKKSKRLYFSEADLLKYLKGE